MKVLDELGLSETIKDVAAEFASATDFGSIVTDVFGQPLSPSYNFTDFCKNIRQDSEFLPLCQLCDREGGRLACHTGKITPYRCHAGLVDFSLPLIHNNIVIALVQVGQKRLADEDAEATLPQTATSSWSKNRKLMHQYDKIERINSERLESTNSLLNKIGDYYLNQKLKDTEDGVPLTRLGAPAPSDSTEKSIPRRIEIYKAMLYVDANIEKKLTVNGISAHVHLSPHYFCRLFAKDMGVTFIDYVNTRKLIHARKLLESTNLSIDQIAHKIAFSQREYFDRLFKKTYDVTPAQWRKKCRA